MLKSYSKLIITNWGLVWYHNYFIILSDGIVKVVEIRNTRMYYLLHFSIL